MRRLGVVLLLLAACAPSEPRGAQTGETAIAPADFALTGCGDEPGACVLISAGGKLVLAGAPAGVSFSLSESQILKLDIVLLRGLAADEIQGLDELRHGGWVAGRQGPLKIAGPEGVNLVARGVNTAFQASDALEYAASAPRGGYGAALLAPVEPPENLGSVLDTGDLKVTAYSGGAFQQAYVVSYDGLRLLVMPCAGPAPESAGADRILACSADQAPKSGELRWPGPGETVFIRKKAAISP